MKITRKTSRHSGPPYNPIFTAYTEEAIHLLQQRADVDPYASYVPMLREQEQVIAFAQSGSTDIGLLTGDIGVGKSSLLRYLRFAVWDKMPCAIFPEDLSNVQANNLLRPDFYAVSESEQWKDATRVAQVIIEAVIRKVINQFYLGATAPGKRAVFDFVRKHFPGAIRNPLAPIDVQIQMLEELSQTGEMLKILFYFYLLNAPKARPNGFEHVKFVLDNTDHTDPVLIKALSDVLASWERDVRLFSENERRQASNTAIPLRRLSGFVACRPATAARMRNIGQPGINPNWYAFHELPIYSPCSLAEAITKRYNYLVKTGSLPAEKADSIKFPINKTNYQIEPRVRLLEVLCECFEKTGQIRHIVALYNNDLASAKGAMLEVLKNNRFYDTRTFLEAFRTGKQEDLIDASKTIPHTAVLRTLAYGNPGSEIPFYPVDGSPVVNILHSRFAPFARSTVKPRLLTLFETAIGSADKDRVHFSVSDIVNKCTEWFGMDRQRTVALIDEMFNEGLIGNTRICCSPALMEEQCALYLLSRGEFLIDRLRRDTILLQCYRDALDLDTSLRWKEKSPNWKNVPTWDLSIEEQARDIVWIAIQLWVFESEQIDAFVEQGRYAEFRQTFGDQPITSILISGIENAKKAFYDQQKHNRSDQESAAYAEFELLLKQLKEEVEGRLTLWQ